ncbi:MAG: adenylate kinase [Patescibacteria group bacterium]|nr:MAG: adenylate kinase [Patescibacteria group bacterium]
MRIAIIGAPGSGKTTQSQSLARSLGISAISIGARLRQLVREGGPGVEEAERALEKGDLIPDELTISLLRKRLSQSDAERGFVLDGMPRTIGEAREMMGMFALNRVFHLRVSFQIATERLMQRGRSDDRPELIQRRFEIYEQEIKPILVFYRSLGSLVEIDASTPALQDISQEIMSKLQ